MTLRTAKAVGCAALLFLSVGAAGDDSGGSPTTSSNTNTKGAAKAAVRHPGSSTQSKGGVGPSTRASLPPDTGAVRSPGASRSGTGLPTSLDKLQAAALARVNYYRNLAGLPPVAAEPRLLLVAQAHSSYLDSTNEMGHYEDKKNNPFYTGNSPFDRIDFSGYDYAEAGEVVARQHSSHPAAAVDALMTAVYHRFIILSVDFVHAGPGVALQSNGGADELDVTVDFGAEALPPDEPHSAVTVYPVLGQTGVPTDFDPAQELPSPMPGHSLVGYPITIQVDARRKLAVESFELFQTAPVASQALPAKLLTHAADAETPAHGAALIPVSPLAPVAIYKAVFTGTVDGTPVSTSWEFMTAPQTPVTMSFALPKVPPGGIQRVTLEGLDAEKGPYYLCYSPAQLVKSLVHESETQVLVTTGTDCDPGASCDVSLSASYHSCAKPFAGGTFAIVEEGN